MKTWDEVEKEAKLILDFLKKPVFFDGSYKGGAENKIIFDASLAAKYSNDDSGDQFIDWQSLLESVTPAWPDMPRKIEKNITKEADQVIGKCHSGISMAPLIYNMQGDIFRLLHCYAFGYVHPLWKKVEQAYLDGGIPCGWDGNYPDGRLVVFSNHPINAC